MPHKSKKARNAYNRKRYHSLGVHRAELLFQRQLVRWKDKFHLTDERILELLDLQKDVCAICGEPFADGLDSLVNGTVGLVPSIDHDHDCCPGETTCGKCVRGIVHLRCNRLCGMAKDDPVLLKLCAEYLEKWKK